MKWKCTPQIEAVPVSLCTLNYSHWLPGKAAIYQLQEMLSMNISTDVCRFCRYLGFSCGKNIGSTKSCAVLAEWPCRQGLCYWFITVKGHKSKYCTAWCYWETTQLQFTIFKWFEVSPSSSYKNIFEISQKAGKFEWPLSLIIENSHLPDKSLLPETVFSEMLIYYCCR